MPAAGVVALEAGGEACTVTVGPGTVTVGPGTVTVGPGTVTVRVVTIGAGWATGWACTVEFDVPMARPMK